MGSLRVGHNWETSPSLFTFIHRRRKWQPTPVFLPGESQDGGAWWAAVYGVTQSWTWLKWLSSSRSIIRKAKNISSFGETVVWNYQILEEIRNVNNVTPSFYNMKKMRPRKRRFLPCLRSQSYSTTSSCFPLKLPSHTRAMPRCSNAVTCVLSPTSLTNFCDLK